MSVAVVVGGQYGSEGKGKLVAHLARTSARDVSAVRCGGTNSGHTVEGPLGNKVLRQLPSAVFSESARLFLAAGMILDIGLLLEEIEVCNLDVSRLKIDRNAVVLNNCDVDSERSSKLGERVASTLSGSGAALARKVLRDPGQLRAAQMESLMPLVTNVSRELHDRLLSGDLIIVEGTQGYGLSLHHSDHFPFVTSRDTTAAAFLSESGLSPASATDVYVVFRTYPIRVGGNSGPLYRETTWDKIRETSAAPRALAEFTSVTGRLRRVGHFDWELAEAAVRANSPTGLAVHGVDYFAFNDFGKTRWDALSEVTKSFVHELEDRLHVRVKFVFTGPGKNHIVDLRDTLEASHVEESGHFQKHMA